jgi:thiamine-monophosphate kinase
VVRGVGDDAAVVRAEGVTVTSVDAFVEGVHFRLATTSLRDLGHKCLAASLSDLAAMGAKVGEAYLTLGLPPQAGEREALELVEGAEALAAEVGASICGGDLTRAGELFVAVTVVGHAQSEHELVGRDGAKAGELLGLTGSLGGSAAGLVLLELKGHGLAVEVGERLLDRHRRPQPRIEAGGELARSGVSAMIDISDGLASDCQRLAEASGVEIDVELARLPMDDGVAAVAELARMSGADLTVSGGEDYELLFTAPQNAAGRIESAGAAAGAPVTWIGEVRAGKGVRLLDEQGSPRSFTGWDHLGVAPWGRFRRGPAAR